MVPPKEEKESVWSDELRRRQLVSTLLTIRPTRRGKIGRRQTVYDMDDMTIRVARPS